MAFDDKSIHNRISAWQDPNAGAIRTSAGSRQQVYQGRLKEQKAAAQGEDGSLPLDSSKTTLTSRVAAWQDPGASAIRKSSASRQQDFHGMLKMQKLSGHQGNYGLPEEGSRTEFRAKQAGVHISKEIVELCTIIQEIGEEQPDGTFCALFGDLFETYTKISNKLVGMLMRARKQGLINFKGEMLFQRQDDHVPIFLLRTPEELAQDLGTRQAELMYHPSK